MKRFFAAAAMAAVIAPALAADIGVSISVGQPGFYGQINIGDFPSPQVINRQPVIIQQVPGPMSHGPIYLRVPPGHAKHWKKHCREYNACGQPVYFVQDKWYNETYVPRYRERNDNRNDRDARRDEHRDEYRDAGPGRGHRGHDRGRD